MFFTYVAAIYGFLARPGAVSYIWSTHMNSNLRCVASVIPYKSGESTMTFMFSLSHTLITMVLQFNSINSRLTASVQMNATTAAIMDRQNVESQVKHSLL